jgi:hypothetical protein
MCIYMFFNNVKKEEVCGGCAGGRTYCICYSILSSRKPQFVSHKSYVECKFVCMCAKKKHMHLRKDTHMKVGSNEREQRKQDSVCVTICAFVCARIDTHICCVLVVMFELKNNRTTVSICISICLIIVTKMMSVNLRENQSLSVCM